MNFYNIMYRRYGRGEQEDYNLIDYMVRNPSAFENTPFLEDLQNPENLQDLEKYVKTHDEEYIPQKTVKKVKEKHRKKIEKLEARQEKAKTRKAEKKAAADIKKAEKKALAEIRKAEKKELNKQYYCGLESKKPKKKSMGSYDVCHKLGKVAHYGEMTEAQYRQRILDDFKKVIDKHENINRDTQKEILSERKYIKNMKMPKRENRQTLLNNLERAIQENEAFNRQTQNEILQEKEFIKNMRMPTREIIQEPSIMPVDETDDDVIRLQKMINDLKDAKDAEKDPAKKKRIGNIIKFYTDKLPVAPIEKKSKSKKTSKIDMPVNDVYERLKKIEKIINKGDLTKSETQELSREGRKLNWYLLETFGHTNIQNDMKQYFKNKKLQSKSKKSNVEFFETPKKDNKDSQAKTLQSFLRGVKARKDIKLRFAKPAELTPEELQERIYRNRMAAMYGVKATERPF